MALPAKFPLGSENRLLTMLPRHEYSHLQPHLKFVRLKQGEILYGAGDHIDYAYFIMSGGVSLFSLTEQGSTIEIGLVGNEGVVGISAVLRVTQAAYQMRVQTSLTCAMRIKAERLREAFNRGGLLQEYLLRYIHMLLTQISQSAVCHHFHTVEERLCRLLLSMRDCLRSDTIFLTQELLSLMLGAPRTSVTMTASALQKAGLIHYRRGRIEILDPDGLEALACECYRVVRDEKRQFLDTRGRERERAFAINV